MATALTPLLGLGATATVRSSSFLGNTGEDWDILGTLGMLGGELGWLGWTLEVQWDTLGHIGSDTGGYWGILGILQMIMALQGETGDAWNCVGKTGGH